MGAEVIVHAAWVCRLVVVLVFGSSAVSKLRGREVFADFLDAVHTLSGLRGRVAIAAGCGVVAAEAAVVVALLVPPGARWGFGTAGVLLGVFTWRLAATGTVTCRCFGAATGSSARVPLVRNLVLAVICGAGWGTAGAAGALTSVPGPALVLYAAGAAALAGGLVFLPALVDLFTVRV